MRHLLISIIFFVIILLLPRQGFSQESNSIDMETTLEDLLNIEINTATKYNKKVTEVPASVSIVTSDDIERYGYDNLAEVLTQLSGYYTSYDRNYTYLGARGFSRPSDFNNRIKLLIDGHSTNEGYYGSTGIGTTLPIDVEAIERIEVVRGPGSALYGTGAMFSVINIITKTTESQDGLTLTAKSGDFGNKGISGLFCKELSSDVDISLSGQWTDIEGHNIYFPEYNQLATNYGIAEGLDWSRYNNFMGSFSYENLTISGYYSNSEKGIPTASYETDFNHDESFTTESWSYLKANYNNKLSSSVSTDLSIYYDHYNYEGVYPYDNFITTDANWVSSIGGEIQLLWDVFPNDRFISGLEYKNYSRAEYKYWGEDGEIYAGHNNPYNIISLYVQNEFQAYQNLSLIGGLRYDEYSIFGGKVSPRVALVYHPAELTSIKMLYGQAFRMPTLYEAYFEDPISDYRSNLNLKPEEITTFEFVVEQVINKNMTGKVAFYSYRMNDLIDYYEDPTEGYFQYKNNGKVTANGVELETRFHLNYGFSAYSNYTYEHAHPSNSHEELSNSPTHMFKAGMSSVFAKHFKVGTEAYYETERMTVNETETEAYLLVNLNLVLAPELSPSSAMAPFLNNTKLSLRIKNLFDQEYANPGGYEHLQDQIVQDGRTFVVKLSHLF